MQPHSVAIANVTHYLLQGASASSCTVRVDYTKDGSATFDMYDFYLGRDGVNVTGSVSSRRGYRCNFLVLVKHDEITIKHMHDPVQEKYSFDLRQIWSGSISGSRKKNGSLSGTIRSDGREVDITATTTGVTYKSKIS